MVNRNAQIGLVKGTYTDEGLDSFWELLEGKASKETAFPQWGAAIQVWSVYADIPEVPVDPRVQERS